MPTLEQETHNTEAVDALIGKEVVIWFHDGKVFSGRLNRIEDKPEDYLLVKSNGLKIELSKGSIKKIKPGNMI